MPNLHGSHWIRPEKRALVYARDGHACVFCARDLSAALRREVTLDHLIPRIAGGSHHETNVATCCLACNQAKGNGCWRAFAGDRAEFVERQRLRPLDRARPARPRLSAAFA